MFNETQLQEITKVVDETEEKSRIEIVPVFMEQADFYEIAIWRGSFFFGIATSFLLLTINLFSDLFWFTPPLLWTTIIITAFAVGALLTYFISPIKRLMTGKKLLIHRAQEKAKIVFLEHGVINTQQRIGVLLFISFFEKTATIIPDEYLKENIDPKEWNQLIQELTQAIKQGKIHEGIANAIKKCGDIVVESGIVIESEENEIDNELRVH